MKNIFLDSIYKAVADSTLLAKLPMDRIALENALIRVGMNEGRIMAAMRYQKPIKTTKDAKKGKDYVAIEGVTEDFHLVLIERIETGKHGVMIFGKDFMRGDGIKPYGLRKFCVSRISGFTVTGSLPVIECQPAVKDSSKEVA